MTPQGREKPASADRLPHKYTCTEQSTDQPSYTAIAAWLDIAVAPWHGTCRGCGHELGMPRPELAAARDGGWVCTRCLTELVRAAALAACREVAS